MLAISKIQPSLIKFAVAAFLLAALAPATRAADELSWSSIDKLRTTLEARSPVAAEFTQSLVPAGFSPEDGDVESGRLSMNLQGAKSGPACLRWDYLGDFAKSFLLCDDQGYYWNPGETVGQIFSLDGKEEAPGLDFFLQSSQQLRQRYEAKALLADGLITIQLVPHTPTEDVVSLKLVLVQKTGLLSSMSYDDIDGNRTTFELGEFVGRTQPGQFAPPADVSWESQ